MSLPKKILKYFRIARKIAKKSSHHYRHGAVLVKGGSLFNCANNDSRFCSFATRFKTKGKHPGSLHAELATILGVSRRKTTGADIYVVRIGKNGELRNSKPCKMCQKTCRYVGINRIFYSKGNGEYGVICL